MSEYITDDYTPESLENCRTREEGICFMKKYCKIDPLCYFEIAYKKLNNFLTVNQKIDLLLYIIKRKSSNKYYNEHDWDIYFNILSIKDIIIVGY